MKNNHVPILGRGPSREQVVKAQVSQAISGLSLQIYSQLAARHIEYFGKDRDVSREALKGLAKNAHLAAQMYFEGLGIIET